MMSHSASSFQWLAGTLAVAETEKVVAQRMFSGDENV